LYGAGAVGMGGSSRTAEVGLVPLGPLIRAVYWKLHRTLLHTSILLRALLVTAAGPRRCTGNAQVVLWHSKR
jgi:hypothetical protein